jgi:carbon-monoxide dehydrogenase large subunit
MTAYIGEPIVRREDVRLLTGAGRYVDDVHLDGMLHAALFRSSWAHGRLRKIDIAAAAAVPDVAGVFIHSDFESLQPIRSRLAAMPGFENFLQLPLATDKVRYVGEPIAVVVATNPYIAEDAAALISAEIDSLPPILDWETANDRSLLIHEGAGTNTSTIEVGRGDAEAAFKSAYYSRRERFSVQRHTAVPMEARGLAAVWDANEECMTVFGITKVPFFNRSMLASMLGLPESAVIMNVADAGGGFGVRGEFYPEDFLIPALARKLDRPV